jgi:hypothetical protein
MKGDLGPELLFPYLIKPVPIPYLLTDLLYFLWAPDPFGILE